MDIIAESVADDADYRMYIRKLTMRKDFLYLSQKTKKKNQVYENYYEFSEAVKKIAGYRILAINRGEKEKFLTVKIEAPEERILRYHWKRK